MRKFKYIRATNRDLNLTKNKIYDLIDYIVDSWSDEDNNYDQIIIENDKGMIEDYYMFSLSMRPIFEEATEEYRNEIIDEILK